MVRRHDVGRRVVVLGRVESGRDQRVKGVARNGMVEWLKVLFCFCFCFCFSVKRKEKKTMVSDTFHL